MFIIKQALCYYYLKDYEQALVCFGKYDGNDKKIQKIIEDCKKQENVIQQEGVTNENMQSSGIQKESDYIESNKELLKYENYNKAVKYYEEKNYEQAIVYLKKYIKETQNQEAKYFLAYLYHLSVKWIKQFRCIVNVLIMVFKKEIVITVEEFCVYKKRNIKKQSMIFKILMI